MNGPIRILHVIGIMNRGGAETMIMNLYRHIDRERVQFDFVENSYEPAAFDDEICSLGGKIYRCPHYNGKNHFIYVRWWKCFFNEHKGEYRIIHGHLGSTAAIYLKIAKKHGLFTIAHSHNADTSHSIKSELYRLFSFRTRYIADYFFACSHAAGVDRYGDRIVISDRYKELSNAIETERFSFDERIRAKVRKEMGLSDSFVLGNVGRFSEQKNHVFLIRIFKEIVRLEPNAKLLLVGDGVLKDAIMKRARAEGLFDRIIFTGVREDVDALMQAMDVFVFPSLYEGLPVSLVEAQAAGLPCVISDSISSESILIDELVTVCGLHDTPRVWSDKITERKAVIRKDRQQEIIAKGYDIRDTVKQLEEFYIAKYQE